MPISAERARNKMLQIERKKRMVLTREILYYINAVLRSGTSKGVCHYYSEPNLMKEFVVGGIKRFF